jgi:anti-sigma-K factor RskA
MQQHEQFAGDLTRYLLGELAPGERAELERHLGACGACRAELRKLHGDIALLALASPVQQPPAHARQRLLDAIAHEPKLVPMPPREERPRLLWWLWAPSVAALVLAIAGGLLWRDNQDLRHEARDLASIVAQTQLDYQHTKELLATLTDQEAMHVTLMAEGATLQPHARATYVPKKGTLVFMANNLGPLPPKKAYQLWLVPSAGGNPISAGTFKPDERGSAMVMRHSAPGVKAKMFAVTVEREEGTSSPTMPMVLVSPGG